jgi:hypothetical protein
MRQFVFGLSNDKLEDSEGFGDSGWVKSALFIPRFLPLGAVFRTKACSAPPYAPGTNPSVLSERYH